jgi:DNA invertase Pin-like site-specific DNA recombinase
MLALHREVCEGDLVLCSKLDRWSRDTEHTLKSVREILEKGASFYAIDDACDPSTRDGHMMMTMRAMMAREEHARIKDRLVGTRMLLRNAGLYADGLVPLGYVRTLPKGAKGADKNVLIVEPEGAKIVRRVFAMCIAGKSLTQIGASLDMRRDRVFSILNSRTYLGQIQSTSGEWIKARHPAIIDADTFARAHAALDGRRLGSAKPNGAPAETSTWFLRDVAKCTCGARMGAAYAGPKDERRRHYFRCSRRCGLPHVPVRAAEEAASPLILARLQAIRDELGRVGRPAALPELVDTSAKRAKLAARRDRFVEQHAEGMIDTATLRTKLAAVDEALLELDAEDGAARRPSPLDDPKVRRELLRSVEQLATRWERAPAERRRQIVNVLAVEVALEAGQTPAAKWKNHDDLSAEVA